MSFGEGDASPSLDRTNSAGKKSISGVGLGSPVENADLLYEYFPLSLDDWYVVLLYQRKKILRDKTGCLQ